MQQIVSDDLSLLLKVLPPSIVELMEHTDRDKLFEIVLDLGRMPIARYSDSETELGQNEVSETDIDFVASRVGEFSNNNRAGITRTLHRIAAIRDRKGRIIGLTCRVGRAIYGTTELINDIIESDHGLLFVGPPGSGKTTILRETARILAEKKRVIIIDTSNEIAGDGDIPHPCVGRARRIQVPTLALQHELMMEAVVNHRPQVIIIDEIGREIEAESARKIAERGVRLIGTVNARSLENIMMDPGLMDLIGGIESVTLSEAEAHRRGTQKSILERKAPPTFDTIIEISESATHEKFVVVPDVAAAVDSMLRNRRIDQQIRYRDESGAVRVERVPYHEPAGNISSVQEQLG